VTGEATIGDGNLGREGIPLLVDIMNTSRSLNCRRRRQGLRQLGGRTAMRPRAAVARQAGGSQDRLVRAHEVPCRWVRSRINDRSSRSTISTRNYKPCAIGERAVEETQRSGVLVDQNSVIHGSVQLMTILGKVLIVLQAGREPLGDNTMDSSLLRFLPPISDAVGADHAPLCVESRSSDRPDHHHQDLSTNSMAPLPASPSCRIGKTLRARRNFTRLHV